MLEIFLISILTFFACIGMAHVFNGWLLNYFETDKNARNLPSAVYYVKNRQNDIENVIRTFLWRLSAEKRFNEIVRLDVVDLGSEDETYSILKRLEDEYDFLHVFDKKSYINKIEQEA